jgi:hypothetical protein
MKARFLSLNLDFFGFSASMVCAVHCGVLPILLTLSAFGGLHWMHTPWIEFGFIGISMIIAAIALTRNFFKHVHIRKALYIVLIGFLLLLLGRFSNSFFEAFWSVVGGLAIATGHIVNWQLARRSECCKTH